MKTATLVSVLDSAGTTGLVVAGMELANANANTEGFMLAHDLIEHVNGPALIGNLNDELEAFGAIWITRGQFDDIRRGPFTASSATPIERIGRDIASFYDDYISGTPLSVRNRPEKPGPDDDAIAALVAEAYRVSFKFRLGGSDALAQWSLFARTARDSLARGARKCRANWDQFGATYANSVFWEVANAVDAIMPDVVYTGQRYTLTYAGDGPATCTRVF